MHLDIIKLDEVKALSKKERALLLEFESMTKKGDFYSTSFIPYTHKDKIKLMEIIKETKCKGFD
ncbi:hypothetical protein [Clostridium hydrogeniformans]|uniref:hypothetical protein n=1 Tax=Clostridium hydrogeniformans TaxID=349933 RepID=UPI000488956A|nr:hypothetical protein [Clostridium hydrogeniformans]